jgi:hypothetical protein
MISIQRGCWYPDFQIQKIKTGLDLDTIIQGCNLRDQYLLARAVKLNWLVSNLQTQPLIKPVLLNNNFSTIQGDTRVLALMLLETKTVPAVVFKFEIQNPDRDFEPDGTEVQPSDLVIESQDHFRDLAKIESTAHIVYEPAGHDPFQGHIVQGMHIHDSRCVDHLEDWNQRAQCIHNYLEQYPSTVFDQNWFLTSVDWSHYSTNTN